LIDADLSIGNKRTPRQDAKSNVAQDDEQHNTALRRRNHKKTQKRKLDICENHLFRSKEKGKKMSMGDFRSKNDKNHPSSMNEGERKFHSLKN